jgi:hypothetical protein
MRCTRTVTPLRATVALVAVWSAMVLAQDKVQPSFAEGQKANAQALRQYSWKSRTEIKRKSASRTSSIFPVNPSPCFTSPIRRFGSCGLQMPSFVKSQGQSWGQSHRTLATVKHQPNVKANVSTPASRNSISNWRSTIGCGCRIS